MADGFRYYEVSYWDTTPRIPRLTVDSRWRSQGMADRRLKELRIRGESQWQIRTCILGFGVVGGRT